MRCYMFIRRETGIKQVIINNRYYYFILIMVRDSQRRKS